MNYIPRKLPIGIQSFEDLRKKEFLYVDKTALAWRIANSGKAYFFSRPRRFGKSLLLSTFKAYFEGRKDLFKDLAIEQLETEWEAYPILRLDLNAEKYDEPKGLEAILNSHLNLWEDRFGKDEREKTPADRFSGVIRRAYEQTGKQVVVLIDEYDKPMLQALGNEALSEAYRSMLKGFYGVLKSADDYLRFAFLTGVTKFAQVSVFSDLNQLRDISMEEDYATLCGITKAELLEVFTPELKRLAEKKNLTFEETVDKMTAMYDGYHFHSQGEGMFNPFSVLRALESREFNSYWFQTGTPTYLVKLLQDTEYDIRKLIEGVKVDSSDFSEYRADPHNPIPMIYQSGYLTIQGFDEDSEVYTLGFPNNEVSYGFLRFLVPYYTPVSSDKITSLLDRYVDDLHAGDVPAFLEEFKAFFAGIPYELSDDKERHYQVVFYLVFRLLGRRTTIDAEVRSARGRADAVIKTKDRIYVFEFKLNGTAEQAMAQIETQGYLEPYATDPRQKVAVGVEFSKEKRNIDRYIVKNI